MTHTELVVMEEIKRLIDAYAKKHLLKYVSLQLYSDGSGRVLNRRDKTVLVFDSIDELKRHLIL